MSANFIQNKALDSCLIIRDEPEQIKDFNEKFNYLKDLMVLDNEGQSGSIRRKIEKSDALNFKGLFELPTIIETKTHADHWIKHYPSNLCPDSTDIKDNLYIIPFDIRGRDLYIDIIDKAKEFVYLSAESFTDVEFSEHLMRKKLSGTIIKILCGATSMDFSERIQKMFRELLAYDIELKTFQRDLHAKLLITDKHIVVSSINLNKMNLGFNITKKYWRENTETAYVCSDIEIIKTAKEYYENIYSNSLNIENIISEKITNQVGRLFNATFSIRTKKEVKSLFAKFILTKEIEVKKATLKLANITKKLVDFFDKTIVSKEDFLLAVILYYLSERKHEYSQLQKKLKNLDSEANLNRMIQILSNNRFIEIEEDFYKLNINSLF